MAQISRSTKVNGTTTLQSNSLARAVDVETDTATLVAAHNNHDSGASSWTVLKSAGATSVPLDVDNAAGTQNIANFRDNGTLIFQITDGGIGVFSPGGTLKATINSTGIALANSAKVSGSAAATTAGDLVRYEQLFGGLTNYRRPVVQYVSATQIDIENNSTTANTTRVIFPDGEMRDVTENTGSTNKYRRFDITAAAEFTTGTEDSGLRSGLSEATNTWYALYAVKSTINTANFVIAGDTTFPTQGNASTLNSRYGTNGWVFLNYIRNGSDGTASTGDILNFLQVGNTTHFLATNNGGVPGINTVGIRFADTAGATTLTYTYAAGSGNTNIPDTIKYATYAAEWSAVATSHIMKDSSGTRVYAQGNTSNAADLQYRTYPASDGVQLSNGGGTSIGYDICLAGFVDGVLGTNGVSGTI